MKLVADSGSTKTAWAFIDDENRVEQLTSGGINPTQESEAEIETSIAPIVRGRVIESVHFYGSGVIPENKYKFQSVFQALLPNLKEIDIRNDIDGAARALCQNEAGIVGILGTGSNSCVYDGVEVVENIGGFGFILGDEGSGAVLGKKLLSDFLYSKIPTDLYEELREEFKLSTDSIFKRIYFTPLPNRYMATLCPFLYRHLEHDYVQDLLYRHFSEFFAQKVRCYPTYLDLPCHLVGSIAYYFEDSIKKAASRFDIQIGNVQQTPIEGLIKYHRIAH